MSGNEQVQVSGTTNSNINIVFQFITQIEQLCQMQNPADTFQTTDQYNEAVAACTFSQLSVINVTQVCNTPGLTPAQISTCQGLSQ